MNDTWDRMDQWNLVLPPSRPDRFDLMRIRKEIATIPRTAPVAVLGSTPEFRDLYAEAGFRNVYYFDRNPAFAERMSQMRVYRNVEKFIEGDWRQTLRNYTNFFACILSDLTIGNIPYQSRPQFYQDLTRALAENGQFIDRVLTNERKANTLRDIERKYAPEPINILTANYFSCDAIFSSVLIEEAGILDTTAIYDRLSEEFSSPKFSAMLVAAQAITPRDCIWYYGSPWADVQKSYHGHLTFIARYPAVRSMPYNGRAYQYFWRRDGQDGY